MRISDDEAARLVIHRNAIGRIASTDDIERIIPDISLEAGDVEDLDFSKDEDIPIMPDLSLDGIDEDEIETLDIQISADRDGSGFPAFVKIAADGPSPGVTIPAEFKQGNYHLKLPRAFADREAELVVRTPDGIVAENKRSKGRDLGRLSVRLPRPFPIDPAVLASLANPAKNFPAVCVGTLINATGARIDFTAYDLVFYGLAFDANARMRPIAKTRCRASGDFSIPFPKALYRRALARLAVPDAEELDIPLEADGQFAAKLLLVLNDAVPEPPTDQTPATSPGAGPTTGGQSNDDDCGCHDTDGPSGFDAVIQEAEGGAGDALVGDGCPTFRANNVVVDEREYSLAVRLDQPPIEALTLQQPEDLATTLIGALDMAIRAEVAGEDGDGGGGGSMMAMSGRLESMMRPYGRPRTDVAHIVGMLDKIKPVDRGALTMVTGRHNLWERYAEAINKIGEKSAKEKLQKSLNIASRPKLGARNQLDWDDEPTVSQAVEAARGHVLRLKQEWVTDGYSLGALLHTTPLAPGQAKRIAIVDWTRADSGERDENVGQIDDIDANIARQRMISETLNGVISELTRGASMGATGGKGNAQGAAGGMGGLLGFLGAVSGIGASGGVSAQRGNRGIGASSVQNVSDATRQSAGSVRNRNAATVVVTDQAEVAGASTEVIANYNHCHSLNIHHFEVLRHFLVRTRLADVQECLFVPLEISQFDVAKVLRWKNELRPALPYWERRGLSALERLADDWSAVDDIADLTRTVADEPIDRIQLILTLEPRFRRPRTTQELIEAELQTAVPKEEEDDATFVERVKKTGRRLGRGAWDFIMATPVPDKIKDAVLNDERVIADIEETFEKTLPYVLPEIVNKLAFMALTDTGARFSLSNSDATILSTPRNNRNFKVAVNITKPGVTRRQMTALQVSCSGGADLFPEDSNLLLKDAIVTVMQGSDRRRLYRGSVNDDIAGKNNTDEDVALIDMPLTRRERVVLYERDKSRAHRVLTYINREVERFHQVIWQAMDPNRRYMLLDTVQAPHQREGEQRSIAQVTDNELIGVVGNCLVLPVGRGRTLFPDLEAKDAAGVEAPLDLLAAYAPTTPIDPIRVSLPTGGVHAEAVMGHCNSCEKIDNSRFWKWEEHPIPLTPNDISGDMLSSRYQAQDLKASGFDPSLISMQTAPDLPDPTGLSGMLEAIVRSDSFRDAAGLSQSQQNALAAYSQSVQGAQQMATKAQELLKPGANGQLSAVQQRYVTDNMQAISDQIDRLNLPDDVKTALKKRLVEAVIGDADTPSKEKGTVVDTPPPAKDDDTPDPQDDKKPKPSKPAPDAGVYVIELDPKNILFLNFEVGEADLDPEHVKWLRIIASRMTDHQGLQKIVGHASRSGSEADNQALSERRANALYTKLRALGPPDAPGLQAIMKPAIVSAVGERMPTVRSTYGERPAIRAIKGETHKNDPVERSVLVTLKDAVPSKEDPRVISDGDNTFFLFQLAQQFLFLGDMFSNNRLMIDASRVFIDNRQITGPTYVERNDGTKVIINITGPLLEIGNVTFNIGDGVFKGPTNEDDGGGGGGGGGGVPSSSEWIIEFQSPDISQATSLEAAFDVFESIIASLNLADLAGDALGGVVPEGLLNAVASVASPIEKLKKAIKVLRPTVTNLATFAIGPISVGAKISIPGASGDGSSLSGGFVGTGIVASTGKVQPGIALPLNAAGGEGGDLWNAIPIYKTSGDPFPVERWGNFGSLRFLGAANSSVLDDIKLVLAFFTMASALIPAGNLDDRAKEILEWAEDAMKTFDSLNKGHLTFEARNNPDDKEAKFRTGTTNWLNVMALTPDNFRFQSE